MNVVEIMGVERVVSVAVIMSKGKTMNKNLNTVIVLLVDNRGFGRGFDYYDLPKTSVFRHVHHTGSLVQDWLDVHRTSKFFLFFHNYDIHSKLDAGENSACYGAGDFEFRVFSKEFDLDTLFSPQVLGDFGRHRLTVMCATSSGAP